LGRVFWRNAVFAVDALIQRAAAANPDAQRYADADSLANAHGDSNTYSFADSNANPCSHNNSYGYSNAYAFTNGNADRDAHAEPDADSNSNSHAGCWSVDLRDRKLFSICFRNRVDNFISTVQC